MWELDYKESSVLKNLCFWTLVLEKTLESPLDWREIQPVNPKGNQSWIFIGRTAAEADTPILWQPDAKNRLIGEDPDAGKDWRQEENETTEDEMVGWHHWWDLSWWCTGRPVVMQSTGLQRVGHNWVTALKLRWVQLCSSFNILWHYLSLGLEWKLTFSSPVATAAFSRFGGILSAALSQHHLLWLK